MGVLATVLGWLFSGPLDRILKTIDTRVDNETERERIKSDAVKAYLSAQVAVLTGRGWWFPLLFLTPAGFWFASVCLYSVFFCRGCIWPQAWSVAALPDPLNDWMGWIVTSLFVGKAGEALIGRLKQ